MNLDVQAASTAIGTPLWQYTPNGTDAQNFRFEDAGDGFVYIRTLRGTVRDRGCARGHPDRTRGDAGHQAGCEILAWLAGFANPNLQRWRFTSPAISVADPTNFTISSAAVPGKVLQPLDGSTASGIAVVLADPAQHPPIAIPNPWTVTSPRLPSTSGEHL